MAQQYKILTLGCQMNVSDSERLDAVLKGIGYLPSVSEDLADLIVVNSCSVRQAAMDKVYGRLNNWQARRQKHELRTVLTGCVLEADKRELEPYFDVFIDIKNITQLPERLGESVGDLAENYFAVNPSYQSKIQAFVPIMTGCDNFCTFCAVPYTRGREWSRPVAEIVAEVTKLVSNGCKEITLLGQNVNSYGIGSGLQDDQNRVTFPELLRRLNDLPGKFWLRYLTSHPKDASDELWQVMAECDKVTEYLHLPAQAGDNEVLKKMNRHYTIEHYRELIKKARAAVPDLCLSTDIIVGFCGETAAQFEKTVELFKTVRYDMAYLAQYSPRPGTVAERFYDDDVPATEKKRREEVLNDLLSATALAHNQVLIGQTLPVLISKRVTTVLGPTKKYQGKTKSFKNIQVESEVDVVGKFMTVEIISCTPWGLAGRVISVDD